MDVFFWTQCTTKISTEYSEPKFCANLFFVHQPVWVAQDFSRRFESCCHQKCRPIYCMKPGKTAIKLYGQHQKTVTYDKYIQEALLSQRGRKMVTLTFKAKYCRTPLQCIFRNSFETIRLPEHFDLLPLHCFTDHLCPPSSPLGRSTSLHLKFGTVSGHRQDRRTLSVVLGVA